MAAKIMKARACFFAPVAAGLSLAATAAIGSMPDSVVAVGEGFTNRLERTQSGWTDGAVSVSVGDDGCVSISSPSKGLAFVTLEWKNSWQENTRFLGDAWERSFGDLEWRTLDADEILSPWYFLASADGKTEGVGVEVQPSAMACWKIDSGSLSLVLDVRAGGGVVRLGDRTLNACRIVRAESDEGESPWQFGRRFCRLMCPRPNLPKAPVYGYNDWYCAYGKNTATNFLADAEYIVSCANGCANPPYVVMDDGWQKNSPPVVGESGRGPWDAAGANFGMEMPEFCRRIATLGAKPGLWYRPLRAWDGLPEEQRLIADRDYLDPTVPAVKSRIVEDIQRFRDWGFKLVKIDFLSYDLSQIWPCDPLPYHDRYIQDNRKWRNDTRTTAEVMLDLYKAMKDAVGDDVVIIGCNAFSHLAAGVFELLRTGDDTSGRDWDRTRKNGINTLAMRSIQDGAMYKVDADCAGLAEAGAVPWKFNRQWIELLGRSGTPFFVSWKRELATPEVREALSKAFRCASSAGDTAEPLDWFVTRQPRRWRFADGEAEYDWLDASVFAPSAGKWPKRAHIPREKGLFRSQIHRGGGEKSRPDNAMETFLWCWGLGFAPEADARLTKDGVIIAMHDEDFGRIGSGISPGFAKRKIWDMTWAEVRDVDTGSYLGPQYATTRLVTMETVFSAMKGRPERLLYVDEKYVPPKMIAELAERYGVIEQTYYCSPNWQKVVEWRKIAPKGRSMVWLGNFPRDNSTENVARTEAFLQERLYEMAKTGFDGIDQVQIHVRTDLTKTDPFCPSTPFLRKAISLLHDHGVVANGVTWTEGTNAAVHRLLWDAGFDHFTSDFPEFFAEFAKTIRTN
ncbi:MAG: hypothetical protein IJ173_03565 [Kiritimatiellae bacterium]|nr:hypothetical protein [Kiritimatiellia bacterium]